VSPSRYDDELWELVPDDPGPPPAHLRDFVRSLGRAERALDLGCGDGRLTAELDAGELTAYGEVLAGILDGDPLLAVRGDNAEECWRIVEPVLEAWRADEVPLDTYAAGSDGPRSWS
jgi:hypothetical protein